jgi:hypothetical protein
VNEGRLWSQPSARSRAPRRGPGRPAAQAAAAQSAQKPRASYNVSTRQADGSGRGHEQGVGPGDGVSVSVSH